MGVSPLGAFEELILLAVCILGEKAYSVSIFDEIESQTGRSLTLGAIHSTLYRLQDKGLLTSSLGASSQERGGRRKRLFSATSAGLDAVQSSRSLREQMWSQIPDSVSKKLAATLG